MDNITFIQTYCASKTYLPQITNQTITVPPCFQHLAKIPESIFIAALFLLNFKIIAKSRYKPYFIENKYKSSWLFIFKILGNVLLLLEQGLRSGMSRLQGGSHGMIRISEIQVLKFTSILAILYFWRKRPRKFRIGKARSFMFNLATTAIILKTIASILQDFDAVTTSTKLFEETELLTQKSKSRAEQLAPYMNLSTLFLSLISEIIAHQYQSKRSFIMFIFWFVKSCSISTIYFLLPDTTSKIELYTTLFMLILHCFNEPIKAESKIYFPRIYTSCFNYLYYNYMSDVIKICNLNRKAGHDTNDKDASEKFNFEKLWKIDPALSCQYNSEELMKHIEIRIKEHARENKLQKSKFFTINFIYLGIIKKYKYPIILSFLFSQLSVYIQFLGPQIRKRIIHFTNSEEPDQLGYFYCFLLFMLNVIVDHINTCKSINASRLSSKVKYGLSGLLYRKSLTLSSKSKNENSTGQLVTFLTTDLNKVVSPLDWWSDFIELPFKFVLTLYYINYELGRTTTLVFLISVIIIMPISFFINKASKENDRNYVKAIEKRVKTTTEVLSGIQVFKLYGWERKFKSNIDQIREDELSQRKYKVIYNTFSSFLWSVIPVIITAVGFIIYVNTGTDEDPHVLTAAKAFVTIQYIGMLSGPMNRIPALINDWIMTGVSLDRISRFFGLEDRCEKNVDFVDDHQDVNDQTQDRNNNHDTLIELKSAYFNWDTEPNKKDRFHLKNINLKIKTGELVVIIGSVGSGKSSLIQAILGEMPKYSGLNLQKKFRDSFSYTPQLPWILNMSLKDNVLLSGSDDSVHHHYDENKYQNTLKNCALIPDLKILPSSDQTEIGEKGINLSGGQKQRVSLARAIYKDSNIYIFDDPLSAVDSHVGKFIFDRVMSNDDGCLKNKTRILVTNSMQYVSRADKVVILDQGEIKFQGSYIELVKDGSALKILDDFGVQDIGMENKNSKQSSITSNEQQKSDEKQTQNDKPYSPEKAKLIKSEIKEDKYSSFQGAKSYLKTIGRSGAFLTIFLNLAHKGSMWVRFYILTKWADYNDNAVATGNNLSNTVSNTENLSENRNFAIGFSAISLVQLISLTLQTFCILSAAMVASRIIHGKLIENLLRLPMSFFHKTPIGRIINRFSGDISTIDRSLPYNFIYFPGAIVRLIIGLLTCFWITPKFLIVLLPMAYLFYFLQQYFVPCNKILSKIRSSKSSPIYSNFAETLQGISSIRAFGLEAKSIKKNEKLIDDFLKIQIPAASAQSWLSTRLSLIQNILMTAQAVFTVKSRDTLSSAFVGLAMNYGSQVVMSFRGLVRMVTSTETNLIAFERVREYCEVEQEGLAFTDYLTDHRLKNIWPHSGKIEFKNFSTKYDTTSSSDLVLKNLNFTINPGEKIGIVGRTGAGKSSLTLSLFRIIEAVEGSIFIDGVDISKIGLAELREKLTIIPQDPLLFSGSLRYNLDPSPDSGQSNLGQTSPTFSDEKIWQILEASNLKSFIHQKDQGLNFQITENGNNVSVGQKQLLCLARALLRNTKILILDEATAAVDPITDEILQKTIRNKFESCTILTIAHRLNTIMDYDRIMVMDQGEIVEFDSPRNLLISESGIFRDMCKSAGISSI